MGRGRKSLIEQSLKKPKQTMYPKFQQICCRSYVCPDKKNDSVILSKDFLEALKRMEPKEVADILFK